MYVAEGGFQTMTDILSYICAILPNTSIIDVANGRLGVIC